MRTGKGKTGRRPPMRTKRGARAPLMPIVVGAVLGLLAIGLIGWLVYASRPAPLPSTVAGIQCDRGEMSQVHYHAAVQIMYNGVITPIPAGIGIVTDSAGNETCLYWLHVHPQDQNTIHIESPTSQSFTLGQFFDIWNAWSKSKGGDIQRLDSTHVSTFTLTPAQMMEIFIDLQDGKGPQPYTGDPRTIVLKPHEVITIEITPPEAKPPPSFTFAPGL
ncbi:MAG: hypothetical protein ACYDHE_10145 [Candidatus Acidiferrales bacterium]